MIKILINNCKVYFGSIGVKKQYKQKQEKLYLSITEMSMCLAIIAFRPKAHESKYINNNKYES
jgi:hypothetical protein